MQLYVYKLAIRFYYLGICLAAPFNAKARKWLAGRNQYFQRLEAAFVNDERPILWMHCASLGEFEQGRPLLEALRQQQPEYQILLTFFSPSGYEIRKNYEGADEVFYLPLDTAKNAKRFLDTVQPKLVIFVKYEFWYHFLTEVKSRDISCILISAIFNDGQIFFKKHGALYRSMLNCFDHIFVQNESSKVILEDRLELTEVTVAGDTRVDRVLSIAAGADTFPQIDAFAKDHKIMVCGSTWPADETLLKGLIDTVKSGWKFILAPHEVDEAHILAIEKLLSTSTCRYSQLTTTNSQACKVLLIDNIGMLSSLYRLADLAYVGGGFGKSIHNILEPAAFHIPVLYGPKHEKFVEAITLKKSGGGFVISDQKSLIDTFNYLEQGQNYTTACERVGDYMENQRGATTRIMSWLQQQTVDPQ